MPASGQPVRLTLDWGPRFTLSVFNLGLACCAVEFVAASMRHPRLLAPAASTAAPAVDVFVVSGTVTDKLAAAVLSAYAALPTPPLVMSFGACSSSGGPYWDSYSVTKGVDQLIPVDIYVPGCPPRPEALLQALIELQERIAPAPTVARAQQPPVRPDRPGPAGLQVTL